MSNNQTQQYAGIESTIQWFQKAKPTTNNHDLQVQVGCHLEEIQEFVTELEFVETDFEGKHLLGQLMLNLSALATHLKDSPTDVLIVHRNKETLDALADAIVTGTGVAHMMGCDFKGALAEVNRSNFSKFDENGEPVLKSNGKIGKSKLYEKPNLAPFLPQIPAAE